MSIEFSCSQCGQNLRVSDESAGKRAKCPKCGVVNQIPEVAPTGIDDLSNLDVNSLPEISVGQPAVGVGGQSPFGADQANPYSAPQSGYASPFGGAAGKAVGGKIINVPVDIGSVVNYAVSVWQKNLGLLVGATVVLMAISMALSYGQMAIVAILEQTGQHELAIGLNLLGSFGSQFVQIFLGVGLTQMMLKMARRQRVEFSELFNGGSRFLPTLGVSFLFGLAILGGLFLLIIPAIIFALMWWPVYFLVVDNKSPVMESFGVVRHDYPRQYGNDVPVLACRSRHLFARYAGLLCGLALRLSSDGTHLRRGLPDDVGPDSPAARCVGIADDLIAHDRIANSCHFEGRVSLGVGREEKKDRNCGKKRLRSAVLFVHPGIRWPLRAEVLPRAAFANRLSGWHQAYSWFVMMPGSGTG